MSVCGGWSKWIFKKRIQILKKNFFWGGGGARVCEFFYYESKFKYFFWLGGGRVRVSDFFTKNPNLKKNIFFFFWGGGGRGLGGGGRVDGRTDKQAQTNLSLQLLRSWGHVQVMARTSSIHDHFIIWPSSVTLTFNLREQMFRMALLLLDDNNCAKSFWNPCINVPIMSLTSSIYDHFDPYLTPMTLTFNLPKKSFKWHFSSSRTTTVQNYFESHA